MYSKSDLSQLWCRVLSKFKDDFPEYDNLLRKNGWKAGVREKACRAFGWADAREKMVVVNWYTHKNSEEKDIVDTMLHEVAHAIDFCQRKRSGHDAPWKKIAEEIGAIPKTGTKRSKKLEYKYVVALHMETGETPRFLRGYHRKPARCKPNSVMTGTYLRSNKTGTENKIWLFSWENWIKLCSQYSISPYAEDHK